MTSGTTFLLIKTTPSSRLPDRVAVDVQVRVYDGEIWHEYAATMVPDHVGAWSLFGQSPAEWDQAGERYQDFTPPCLLERMRMLAPPTAGLAFPCPYGQTSREEWERNPLRLPDVAD